MKDVNGVRHYDDTNFLMSYLDLIPAIIMIVDEDVRIFKVNRAGAEALGVSAESEWRSRAGDAMHCLHSTETSQGCGYSPDCKTCIIRNSVNRAFDGQSTFRQQTKMIRVLDGSERALDAAVTSAPVFYQEERRVVVILEDITELVALRRLIPICAGCKKIRNDSDYWESVEAYMAAEFQMTFSHGLCPDCVRERYPELADKVLNKRGKSPQG
jgi:nitrogen fixation/metabolism regulation signal transduction histidine kinase